MNRLLLSFFITALLACQTRPKEEILDQKAPASSSITISATVDSLLIPSQSMNQKFPVSIILPKTYQLDTTRHFPSVYLLHGYSGRHTDWISKVPAITQWANLFEVIIILPDGAYNSWYIDSPINDQHQYATYTGQELPNFIDHNYRTIPQKEARAITGLSMGGHGALYLATQYPDQFGAVGSMSGGLDLRPFPENWELASILGVATETPNNWRDYSVISQLEHLKDRKMPIYIDCGKDDFFFETNLQAHQKLDELDIPHEFIVRPGAHNWDYWEKVLPHHLLFFSEFFKNTL